jgi:hypothetical protein
VYTFSSISDLTRTRHSVCHATRRIPLERSLFSDVPFTFISHRHHPLTLLSTQSLVHPCIHLPHTAHPPTIPTSHLAKLSTDRRPSRSHSSQHVIPEQQYQLTHPFSACTPRSTKPTAKQSPNRDASRSACTGWILLDQLRPVLYQQSQTRESDAVSEDRAGERKGGRAEELFVE